MNSFASASSCGGKSSLARHLSADVPALNTRITTSLLRPIESRSVTSLVADISLGRDVSWKSMMASTRSVQSSAIATGTAAGIHSDIAKTLAIRMSSV